MGFNAANLTKVSPSNVTGPSFFQYTSTTDNIATVGGSTYFTPFAHSVSQALLPYQFSVDDVIYCTCSDGSIDLYISSINPIATSQQTVTFVVGPNSVNTAAIQDLNVTTAKIAAKAVTAAKIADSTITTAQISASAAIVGTQLSATAAIAGSQLAASAGITGAQIASTTIAGSNMVANTIATGQLDPSTIQYVQVSLTAAQWNGMYTTPVQLVAAPASGKMIIVCECSLKMTFVAAQYAAGGVVAIQYDNTVHGAGTLASSTIAAATIQGFAASSNISVEPLVSSSAITTTEAKGLFISNQTGVFTTGDGTWHVNVAYRVITA